MVATFTPPHTPPVFRVLKQAYREFIASGAAAVITVATPPNQLVAQGTTVSGTVEVDRSVPMPAAVSVVLKNGATVKATQSAPVNPTTGAFSTVFVGGTLAAGAATATVSTIPPDPTETTVSAAFTVT